MFTKLDYVYAVYKEGNFTRAAEKLFISQPSLSAAIKKLEQEIGAPLFDRSSGGVRLTEVGREYIDCAERIMRIREEFVNRIRDIHTMEIGHITVGGSNYLSSYVLPRIINRFAEQYPKIDVTLTEANSQMLCEMLTNEEIDIMIDSFDESFHAYDAIPLMNEEILLCVPAEYEINKALAPYALPYAAFSEDPELLKNAPTVPLEAFKDEKFILLKPGNDMYSRAQRLFDAADIMPKVAFYVDQLNISYALCEIGMGVCFVTDTLFRFKPFPDKVLIYKLSRAHSGRTLYVSHKKNRYCTRAMTKFIEIAQRVISRE